MESETLAEMGWVVGFVGVVIVLLPMAFYGVDHRTSVVFVSLTPMGNQTDSSNILMADGKADVLTFQLNSDLSAHVVCVLAAIECVLLWWKVCGISSDDSLFTESVVLQHGGMYTANNEFWLFVGIHHVVLVMVVLSPLSIHALLLLVFSYVTLMSMLCESRNDTCDDSDLGPSTEKAVNRVAVLFLHTMVIFTLIVIDQRLNMATFERIGLGSGAVILQGGVDLVLVLVHSPSQISLLTCYLSRIVYVFTCAGMIIWWMCS